MIVHHHQLLYLLDYHSKYNTITSGNSTMKLVVTKQCREKFQILKVLSTHMYWWFSIVQERFRGITYGIQGLPYIDALNYWEHYSQKKGPRILCHQEIISLIRAW